MKKNKSRIILPGELLIDRFERNGELLDKPGGAPANVAVAISKYGADPYFTGAVGNDESGEQLIKSLQNLKLKTDGVIKVDVPTTVANVKIDSVGERSFTFLRGADEQLEFLKIPREISSNYDILHLGSATALLGGELWETYLQFVIHSGNKVVSFDPNYREALYKNKRTTFLSRAHMLIKHADIVKVSDEELKMLTDLDDIKLAAEKLLEMGPEIILVTLGKDGTLVSTKKHTKIIGSVKVQQVDTTGAGDAFIGFVIGYIAANQIKKSDLKDVNWDEVIFKANVGAALTVTRIGAMESIPELHEIEEKIRETA